MSSFADILGQYVAAGEKPARATPFEDAVGAFEAKVAASTFEAAFSDAVLGSFAAELGLAMPCTKDDLKRAFRRRAFETHPDRNGGSAAAFMRVRAVFEAALSALETQSVGTSAPVSASGSSAVASASVASVPAVGGSAYAHASLRMASRMGSRAVAPSTRSLYA